MSNHFYVIIAYCIFFMGLLYIPTLLLFLGYRRKLKVVIASLKKDNGRLIKSLSNYSEE